MSKVYRFYWERDWGFLQGAKIEKYLNFTLPKKLHGLSIPGLEEGGRRKVNKSIYGTNDAARAWYTRVRRILMDIVF